MSYRTSALVLSTVSLSLLLVAVAGCEGRAQNEPQALLDVPPTTLAPDPNSPQYAPTGDAGEPAPPTGGADDPASATDAPADAAPAFTQERLEQLVAPVALYPDPLLMEILMAATYPAEVAEAGAWRKENPNLNGKELDAAIADKGWDVSVNSLTHATKAIELMAADTQWTKDLGDAFLAQQDDVLNAVQIMRSRACDLGNLKTTEQQQVIIEPAPETPPQRQQSVPLAVAQPQRIVRIVPVQPEILYVPVYNPRVIYGPPPPVIYYPRVMLYPAISVGVAPIISFGVGLTIGSLFWGDLDWHNHRVYSRRYGGGYYGGGYYDRYRDGGYNYRRDEYASRAQVWRHDARHRRGVDYRSRHVERTYRSSGDPSGDRDYRQGRDTIGDGRSPQDRNRDGRDGGRDGGRADMRDGSRDKGGQLDRREGSREGGRPDSADKSRGGSQDRGPGDSRGKQGMSGDRSKGSDRVDDKSRGGSSSKPSAVSPRGPSGKGSSGRPESGQAVRPSKPSKPGGGSSVRPPSGDKRGGSPSRGGSSMQRGGSPSRGGGSSMQRGGSSSHGGSPSRGGSSVQRGGGSSGQSGRSGSMQGGGGSRGGAGSSRGGGGQQRGGSGGGQQRGGSGGGNDRGGGGKHGGR